MSARLQFGEYELNVAAYELTRRGRPIKMERIPMELLVLLLERRPDLVTRDEIVAKLWGERVYVDADNAVNVAVSKVRTLLRDSAEGTVFIKSVPGKGYRFIAPVTVVAEEPVAAAESVAIVPPPVPPPSTPSDEQPSVAPPDTWTPPAERKTHVWLWLAIAAAALAIALGAWLARGAIATR